jgi:hypothetical protein
MPPTASHRRRLSALGRQLLVAAAALLLVTCTDNPTGPTVGSTVHLAVSPKFKSGVTLSSTLPVDQVRLIVYRQLNCDCSPDSVAGATAPFALTQDSIQMQLSFTLQQSPETLDVHFDLLGAGQTLFSGDTTVIIRSGVPATVPPLAVYYVGPGADIYFLSIFPRDTVLTFGDSIQFGASGANSLEQPETAFYVSWLSSLASAKVRPDGMLHAPSQRATATIKAQAPNGVTDSTTITFVPKPTSLAKVSGDTQTASINDTLPLPLRVQVKAADNLGVAGVRVVYHPLGIAGPAVPDTVHTDSLGYAQARAVLGDSTGTQQWQAVVAGVTPVTFTATAQLVAGPPYRVKLVTQPSDTTASGALIPVQPVVQIVDSVGVAVHSAGIVVTAQSYTYLTGAPPLKRPLGGGLKASTTRASGPYKSGDTFGQITDSTDATGKVTFTGLRMVGYGSERIVFNAPSLVADTSHAIWITAGAPRNLVKGSTDSTSAFVDSLVATPPAVYVYDSTYNPVPNAAVVFQVTAGGGSIPKPVDTVFTDSTGYAAVASWKLGPNPGVNTLQATVAGAGSLSFTAFAQPPVPTILLQLQGTSVVGVGRTATLLIRLSAPATANDTIYVSSDSTQTITVSGSPIVVLTGDSLASVTLNGIAAGNDSIRATATGYISGAIGVPATVNLISLPTTLTVPFGGTTNISVTLAAPAPAGGVVVTLVSSDSTRVQVLTPTVSFAQGVQTQNGQLGGVALGTATISASNPNYSPATSAVTTAANLNIVAATATIYPAFPDTQTIQFLSGGTPIAAPAGGVLVTLTAADSSCVSVPATVTIIGGLSTAKFPVDYAGVAATPCTSYVKATAGGVGADSVLMTVSKPPTIATGTLDLGAGLQSQVSVSLQTPTVGNLTMTIRPLTVGVARFAPNLTTVGVDTLVIPLVSGTSTLYATVAGVDTVTNDSTYVEISIPGYATDTALVRVRQPGVILYGVPTSTTSLSSTSAIYAYIGVGYVGNTSIQAYQGLRAGHAPVTATFHVTPNTVAALTDSSGVLDTVRTAVVPVQPNVYYTPTSVAGGGVGYHPVGAGSSTTTVGIPGFVNLPSTTGTVVSAPTISFSAPVVGAGLQTSSYTGLGAPAPVGAVATVKSLDPAVLIIADSITKVGGDSAMIPLTTNAGSFYFYPQALEGTINDSARIVVSIPGYKPDSVWGYVRQAGLQIINLPTTSTTFTAKSQFYAGIGLPYVGNSGMQAFQAIRAGAAPLTVTFHTANPAVGKLTDSSNVLDTVRTAVMPVNPASGIYYTPTSVASGGVAYQPIGPGTSTTWATVPGYVTLPSDTVKTIVSAPAINIPGVSVGSGLQVQTFVSLGAATPTIDTLVLKSQNPAAIRLSPNDSTPGTDSIVVIVPANTSTVYFYAQGMEGVVSDSSIISATMPGYGSGPVQWQVRQAGVELFGVNTATTTLSDSNSVYAEIGLPYVGNGGMSQYQALRAGSPGVTLTLRVSDPTVQRFVTGTGLADSVMLSLAARQYYTPTSFVSGGAALKVLTTGVDTVRVTGSPLVPLPNATRAVTVSAPGITMSVPSVGAGLAASGSASLNAPRHGGVNVVVKSSNPSVAQVAPDNVTPGADSIIVPLADGQTYVPFYVIGVDSQVGSPIITASANGFNDGTAPTAVVQPIVELYNLAASQTAGGADNAFYAALGIPYSGTNTFYSGQIRAAGKAPLSVTFTSGTPTVGTLTSTALTAATLNAAVGPGTYYTPTNVGTGGVAFRPLTAGTTTVSAAVPGFLQTVNAAGEVVTVH